MRALVYENGVARYEENHPIPAPLEGESLIRITLAAVCNTDKETLRGYKPNFAGIMGHEFVGVVEQSPRKELVGKRVVGELNAGCGRCLYCRTGREKHCERRRVIGLNDKDGCFADYMTLRTDLLHTVPDSVPDEEAIFTEPLAAAMELTERRLLPPSQPVAVIGDGRLAFLCAQTLALGGRSVTVFGRHADKLAAFSPFANTSLEVAGSFETVVEASGSPSGLQSAARLVRHGGSILLKSTYAGEASVNLSEFVVNEVTLCGSRCGPFAPALRLLERKQLRLPELTLFPLSRWEDAFSSRAFKAGFQMADNIK